MAHGFICPRLLSLSWDTNTHNEHIYFQFDVQNGRGLHKGSHFHYRNQKHKQSEIHPKCPWSQGVLIKQRQPPSPEAGIAPTASLHSPHSFTPGCPGPGTTRMCSLCLCLHTWFPPQRGPLVLLGGLCLSLGMAQRWTHPSDPDLLCSANWTALSSSDLSAVGFIPVNWS